jgi:O-antigen/teichoic acid export membrane protein
MSSIDSSHQPKVKSFARSTIINVVGQVLAQGSFFLAQREVLGMSLYENGVYYFFLQTVLFVMVLGADFGVSSALQRVMIESKERIDEVFRTFFFVRIALLVLIAFGLFSVFYFLYPTTVDVAIIVFFACALSAKTPFIRYTLEFKRRVHSDFALINLLQVVDGILFFVLLRFVANQPLDSRAVAWCYLGSSIPSFLVILFTQGLWKSLLGSISIDVLKKIAKECRFLFSTQIFYQIYDKIDTFFLQTFATPVDVGVLGAVYRTGSPFSTILFSIGQAVLPQVVHRFGQEDKTNAIDFLSKVVRYYLILSISIAVFFTSIMTFVVDLFTKGNYNAYTMEFFYFIWTYIPSSLILLMLEVNVALDKAKNNLILPITMAIVTALCGVILIPMYGVLGAIISKGLAFVVTCFLVVSMLWKIDSSILRISTIVTFLLVICSMFTVNFFLFNSQLPIFVKPIIAFSCFISLLFIFRLTSIGELQQLIQTILQSKKVHPK